MIGRSRDASAPPVGAESAWRGTSPNPRGSSARGRITGPIGVLSARATLVWVADPDTARALNTPTLTELDRRERCHVPPAAPARAPEDAVVADAVPFARVFAAASGSVSVAAHSPTNEARRTTCPGCAAGLEEVAS